MTKLFEILAVEGDLSSKAQTSLKQTKDLFAHPDKFIGQTRRYKPLEDGGQPMPPEDTNVAFRVSDTLDDLLAQFSSWLDVSLQKEVTNQETKATVIIDNQELFELPAPALLNLEQKLAMLRATLAAIPTNDPTERWEWDKDQQVFVSKPRTTYRTEKRLAHHVAYNATEEHPAQVQVFNEDVRVGEWTTTIRSGMWSPNRKREVMERLDALAAAVKQARQRANDIEIVKVNVSEKIVEYLGAALS